MKKIIERQKPFMNTLITIKVIREAQSTVSMNDAFEAAFGEFDRIVKKYTRFNEDSELSNLNRKAGEWVTISEEFFFLIEYMLNLAKETDGFFDPTITDFLEIYGYDKNYDFSKLENPSLNVIVKKRLEERPKFTDIELDKKKLRVKLAPTQKIDLGGVGKGYAIDCAFDKLKLVFDNFLIDAGGDIRASGENMDGKPWVVDLKAKIGEEIKTVGSIELKDEALASSGSWARKVKDFHHIINPTSGEPVKKDYSTVFVKAKTATTSDSYATALFVGGKGLKKKLKNKKMHVLFV